MSAVQDGNRERLLANPNVLSLTKKHIVYTKDFMRQALEAVEKGIPAPSYWEERGFALSDFKQGYFGKCIARWRKQLVDGEFLHKKRGRPVTEALSKDEEIAFLRAENTILKEYRALGIEGRITSTGLSPELFRQIVAFHAPESVNWQVLARQAITNGWPDLRRN